MRRQPMRRHYTVESRSMRPQTNSDFQFSIWVCGRGVSRLIDRKISAWPCQPGCLRPGENRTRRRIHVRPTCPRPPVTTLHLVLEPFEVLADPFFIAAACGRVVRLIHTQVVLVDEARLARVRVAALEARSTLERRPRLAGSCGSIDLSAEESSAPPRPSHPAALHRAAYSSTAIVKWRRVVGKRGRK